MTINGGGEIEREPSRPTAAASVVKRQLRLAVAEGDLNSARIAVGSLPGIVGGYWQRLRLGWYRFVDHNTAANALSADRHCCNKPAKGD